MAESRTGGAWRRVSPRRCSLSRGLDGGVAALIAIDGRARDGRRAVARRPIVLWQTVINGLIHLALVGIGYAWHTAEDLRQARERAARADVLRARAELQLLRSQLHPHFVLNVLHALLGLVRRDPARAESALERLGELLRFGQWVHQTRERLGAAVARVGLRDELPGARARAPGRTAAGRDDGGSAGARGAVPPFALQPLVENAIVHAIAPRASGGPIEVSARRSGGRLVVAVRDDGPGASAAQLGESPRMGLRLLQERLAALYAGRARLSFESPAGGGFLARLELPDDALPEAA